MDMQTWLTNSRFWIIAIAALSSLGVIIAMVINYYQLLHIKDEDLSKIEKTKSKIINKLVRLTNRLLKLATLRLAIIIATLLIIICLGSEHNLFNDIKQKIDTGPQIFEESKQLSKLYQRTYFIEKELALCEGAKQGKEEKIKLTRQIITALEERISLVDENEIITIDSKRYSVDQARNSIAFLQRDIQYIQKAIKNREAQIDGLDALHLINLKFIEEEEIKLKKTKLEDKIIEAKLIALGSFGEEIEEIIQKYEIEGAVVCFDNALKAFKEQVEQQKKQAKQKEAEFVTELNIPSMFEIDEIVEWEIPLRRLASLIPPALELIAEAIIEDVTMTRVVKKANEQLALGNTLRWNSPQFDWNETKLSADAKIVFVSEAIPQIKRIITDNPNLIVRVVGRVDRSTEKKEDLYGKQEKCGMGRAAYIAKLLQQNGVDVTIENWAYSYVPNRRTADVYLEPTKLSPNNNTDHTLVEIDPQPTISPIDELRKRLASIAEENDKRTGVQADVLKTQGLVPFRVGPFSSKKAEENPEVLIQLTDVMGKKLDEIAILINLNEYKIISIRGYADKTSIANEAVKAMFVDDDKLASSRAQAVFNYLNNKLNSKILPSAVVRFSPRIDCFGGIKDNNRCVVIIMQKLPLEIPKNVGEIKVISLGNFPKNRKNLTLRMRKIIDLINIARAKGEVEVVEIRNGVNTDTGDSENNKELRRKRVLNIGKAFGISESKGILELNTKQPDTNEIKYSDRTGLIFVRILEPTDLFLNIASIYTEYKFNETLKAIHNATTLHIGNFPIGQTKLTRTMGKRLDLITAAIQKGEVEITRLWAGSDANNNDSSNYLYYSEDRMVSIIDRLGVPKNTNLFDYNIDDIPTENQRAGLIFIRILDKKTTLLKDLSKI